MWGSQLTASAIVLSLCYSSAPALTSLLGQGGKGLMRPQGKQKDMGRALGQTAAGETTSVLTWNRSSGVEHLKHFSSHVPSLGMKLTRKANGSAEKEKDACSQGGKSRSPSSVCFQGFSSDTFIVCFHVSERQVTLDLTCCPI